MWNMLGGGDLLTSWEVVLHGSISVQLDQSRCTDQAYSAPHRRLPSQCFAQ
jgi:hypothetical protein